MKESNPTLTSAYIRCSEAYGDRMNDRHKVEVTPPCLHFMTVGLGSKDVKKVSASDNRDGLGRYDVL